MKVEVEIDELILSGLEARIKNLEGMIKHIINYHMDWLGECVICDGIIGVVKKNG